MPKITTRQMRSMQRDLYKTKSEALESRKNVLLMASTLSKKLALEKQTSNILRTSLRNFSVPLYKMKLRNKKLRKALTRLRSENVHLKRGLVQLNKLRNLRKRMKGNIKTQINI